VVSMYLDNAATSFPKPDCVTDAVVQWLGTGAAAGRGSHAGSHRAAEMLAQCRGRLARFLDVPDFRQIVLTQNCTESLNTILQGLLQPGDRVIASTMDHNSVLRPLEWLRENRKIVTEVIDFDPSTGLLNLESLDTALRAVPTRLVVLTHASNVTGRIQPLEPAIALAKQHGALVLLDAAQTVGHVPVHFRTLDVDFLAAAGHKGVPGPLGTGFLVIRSGLERLLTPLKFGGTGSSSESLRQPDEMPSKFESGNMNLPGIAGLSTAVEWLQTQSADALHGRIEEAVTALHSALTDLPGVRVYSLPHQNTGIVTFNFEAMDCHEAAMILDESFQIQCRAGLHCAPLAHRALKTLQRGGAIRLSPGVFTTADDVQSTIDALRQIAETLG